MSFYFQKIRNKSQKSKILFYSMIGSLLLNFVVALVIWIRFEYFHKHDGYWFNAILLIITLLFGIALQKRDSRGK